jgi:tRNA uridine 5-carboxymethylaminomethyl modification enzyme
MRLGCVSGERAQRFTSYQAEIEGGRVLLQSLTVTPNEARRAGLDINLDGQRRTAYDLLSYPNYDFSTLRQVWPETLVAIRPKVAEALEIEAGYSVYLDRQATAIADQQRDEERQIPLDFNYDALSGLSNELKAKLSAARPFNIAQAAIVEGMTPAAIALLLVHLRRLPSSERHRA